MLSLCVILPALLWALRANGEIVEAKKGTVNKNARLGGVSFNSLFARDDLRTCANDNGPECGTGYHCCAGESCCDQLACCREGETCCPRAEGCAWPGWVCCDEGSMPEGSDCCEDSYWCEPGTHCIQCPRDSSLYPGQHCCNVPQSSIKQFLPTGSAYSSIWRSLSLASNFPEPSGSGSASYIHSSHVSGGELSSSAAQSESSRQISSQAPPQSSVGVSYEYYTRVWIYYYIVWYTTAIQATSTTITSSTTTETTTLTCYAANAAAASSQFSTLEATVSASMTSMQSSASASLAASLAAAQGAASASNPGGGGGGGAGATTRVDATTIWLLVVAAIASGFLAVAL